MTKRVADAQGISAAKKGCAWFILAALGLLLAGCVTTTTKSNSFTSAPNNDNNDKSNPSLLIGAWRLMNNK
jgi:hypothetical protein